MSLTRFQGTVVDALQTLISEGLVEVVEPDPDTDQAPPADDREWDDIEPQEDDPSVDHEPCCLPPLSGSGIAGDDA